MIVPLQVEHFERELWRKQGDIITVCCEAIPVMAIQFKILSLAPDFSAISVISIILASGIAGSKLSGLTTYTDLRSKVR